MSKIVLGPRIIGKAASAENQRKLVDDHGGGAIQLGARMLKQRNPAGRPVHPVKPKFKNVPVAFAQGEGTDLVGVAEEVVGSVPAETAEVAAVAAPAPKSKRRAAKPQPTDAGLSVDDIETMLADDPKRWDAIAETEAKRAEGFRPRVAQMLLNVAGDVKKEKPMDAGVIAGLQKIAGVGAAADADKLAKAAVEASKVAAVAPDSTPVV